MDVLVTHLDTLALLTTTRPVRERLRRVRVYPLLRELHLAVEDGAVREAVERVVGVLMRDEGDGEGPKVVEVGDEDEDGEIVDVL